MLMAPMGAWPGLRFRRPRTGSPVPAAPMSQRHRTPWTYEKDTSQSLLLESILHVCNRGLQVGISTRRITSTSPMSYCFEQHNNLPVRVATDLVATGGFEAEQARGFKESGPGHRRRRRMQMPEDLSRKASNRSRSPSIQPGTALLAKMQGHARTQLCKKRHSMPFLRA